MKKLIITLIVICLPVVLMAQTTIKNNFVIERSSPSLHLKGSNGVINFNSGDVTLTNTSNTLTIVGGILALPANGLIINSINALYGETDTLSQKYATIASTYTQDQINTLLAGKQDTGVVSMTYPGSGIALSTGTAWGTSITNNSVNWNTAYTDRFKWDGGATGLTPATGRTSLGGTTAGQAFFTLTNPSAITFPRINADNTVTALSAANYKTALGATTVGNAFFTLTNPSAIRVPLINADNTVTATATTGTGNIVRASSPTLTTPNLGTPSAIILTNATGTAASLTAGAVTGYTPASGSLTLSGADAITFTTTGVTGVTLPTSGTLATTTDAALGKLVAITASLSAGAETDVTLTGVTTYPYSLQIFDSDGLDITHAVKDSVGISGGTYHVYIYSTDAKSNALIRVLW